MPNLYILGCFARRVTMYSQQVRALNLIYALHHESKLKTGTSVAVIGGGAAGMMAAAGAAHLGAKVAIYEQFQSPLELQRNNRQRWIHPFIYDWPDEDRPVARAGLPLLDWKAGYAEKVARQIEGRWTALRSRHTIQSYWGNDPARLSIGKFNGKSTNISASKGQRRFDVIILAVGFGLEPEDDSKSSYWSEDNIDGGFRNVIGQNWLVSGCGDGGLIDVMRLCIRSFRAEAITTAFEKHERIGTVKDLLRETQKKLSTFESQDDKDTFLSDTFNTIQEEYDLLRDFDSQLKRTHKPNVFLTGSGQSPYGTKSSMLNKLIICQLAAHDAFTYIPGPSKIKEKTPSADYIVQFGDPIQTDERTFDRVIERWGPRPPAIQANCFRQFSAAFEDLKKTWETIDPGEDMTRKPQWPRELFEANAPDAAALRESEFAAAVGDVGIRAESFTIIKEVRGDGSSTLSYQFERLSVQKGSLRRIHFTFWSTVGSAGSVRFDSEGDRLGLRWEREGPPTTGLPLTELLDEIRQIRGFIVFPEPLVEGGLPLTFGISLRVLNGDALSRWEFAQMYGPEERTQYNGDAVEENVEYLARPVWFPVESLRMKIVLPGRISEAPFLTLYRSRLPAEPRIHSDEVVGEDGTLEIRPRNGSLWDPSVKKWRQVKDPLLGDQGMTRIVSGPQADWEVSVVKPELGSCYSINWLLPSALADLDEFVDRTSQLRKKMLEHRNRRLAGEKGNLQFRGRFASLQAGLREIFLPEAADEFEVSVMAYDETKRELVFVEAVVDTEEFPSSFREAGFPFGLGLAGTAFKLGEIMYHESTDTPDDGPKVYLPLPESNRHAVIFSVPIDHPDFWESSSESSPFDSSRKCIGIVNVGSGRANPRFEEVATNNERIEQLTDICQSFCATVYTDWQNFL